jgi:hypothetical protein
MLRFAQASSGGVAHDEVDGSLAATDPRSNSMEIYLAARRAEILREAMDELPDRCRSLLHLLFFNEEKDGLREARDNVRLVEGYGWQREVEMPRPLAQNSGAKRILNELRRQR